MVSPTASVDAWVLTHTGAQEVCRSVLLQNLWGGYGELLRVELRGGPREFVILKRVIPPESKRESVSDARKRRSYECERAWYRNGARGCGANCRVAEGIAVEKPLLLLEDLGAAGFHPKRPSINLQLQAGLRWLAHFHSRFLEAPPPGLWKRGTYWHLETRRDEWKRMPAGLLKDAAETLDLRLRNARFQTVVHGDAKPANFLWNPRGEAAAVDFQYVGGGCGIRDVAYLLNCCLGEEECEARIPGWIDYYFTALRKAIRADGNEAKAQELETEWRELFPVAWCDFERFLQGWSRPYAPGRYGQSLLRQALS